MHMYKDNKMDKNVINIVIIHMFWKPNPKCM